MVGLDCATPSENSIFETVCIEQSRSHQSKRAQQGRPATPQLTGLLRKNVSETDEPISPTSRRATFSNDSWLT
jgi:hypothetical protein